MCNFMNGFKKWEWKKAIIGILLISILQFCKDEILFFDMWANIVDTINK